MSTAGNAGREGGRPCPGGIVTLSGRLQPFAQVVPPRGKYVADKPVTPAS